MKHYFWSHILLLTGVIVAAYLWGFSAAWTVAILIALEVSLSFDNAVVNAKILKDMSPVWQRRFILFGLPIAVFGMRFLFPILIVAIATGMSMLSAFNLAVNSPTDYQHILEANQLGIFAFGGAFLLMVFLGFFFDNDREHKWITLLEDNSITNKLSSIASTEIVIATTTGLILTYLTDSTTVSLAFFGGVLLHEAIASLDGLLSTNGVRSGLAGLLYLEVLDASFSFDGVIGAFAISSNIFVIMIGLGVGAMYVRSMTLDFVERGTLATYKYLEHGAHYAIGALALLMFIKMFHEVPELVTGSIGVTFILTALVHSYYVNKREAENAMWDDMWRKGK